MVIIIHHLLKDEIIMHSVHTVFMCSYDFENKQQFLIYTALTNQSLYSRFQFWLSSYSVQAFSARVHYLGHLAAQATTFA